MLPLLIILAGGLGIYFLAKNSEAASSGAGGASNSDTSPAANPDVGPISLNVPTIDQAGANKNTSSSPDEPTSETPPTPTGPATEPVPGVNDSVYPFIAVTQNVKGTGGAPVQIFVSRTGDPAKDAADMTRVSYALTQYDHTVKLDSKNGITAYKAQLAVQTIPESSAGPVSSLYNATRTATAPGAGFYVIFIKDWALFLDHPTDTHEGLPAELIVYTATRTAVANLATPDSGMAAVVFPEDLG